MRLMARPRSLERLLLFTIAGLVLLAIVGDRARLARPAARPGPGPGAGAGAAAPAHRRARRSGGVGEDTVTRGAPARRAGRRSRAWCGRATSLQLAAVPAPLLRHGAARRLRAVRRDAAGRRPRASPHAWSAGARGGRGAGRELHGREPATRGPLGARRGHPGLPGGRVVAIRRLDEPLAAELSRAGRRRDPPAADDGLARRRRSGVQATCTRLALATGDIAVARDRRRATSTRRACRCSRRPARPIAADRGAAARRAGRPARSRASCAGSRWSRSCSPASRCSLSLLLARRIGAPIQALANPRRARPGRLLLLDPGPGHAGGGGARAHDGRHAPQPARPHDHAAPARGEAQAVLQGVVEGVYAVDADRAHPLPQSAGRADARRRAARPRSAGSAATC